MDRNPRSLTDSELAQRSRFLPWEETLEIIGCWCMFFSVILAIIVCLAVDRGPVWLEIAVGIILFPCLVYSSIHAVATTRPGPYLRELQRRCGQRDFPTYIAESRKRFSEDASPEWIVLVQGISRSQHSHYDLIIIMLYGKTETRARLEAVTSPEATSWRTFGVQRIRQGVIELGTEESQDLFQFLEQLRHGSLKNIPSTIGKGYPCSVAALRRNPRLEICGSCDLLGRSEADADKPGALLIRQVMALAERASSSPMIQGWGEYAGDGKAKHSIASFKFLESPNSLSELEDADWTTALTLYGLPHRGKTDVRVDLRGTEPPSGRLVSVKWPYEYDPEDPRARAVRSERDLNTYEAASLLTRLQQLEPGALTTIPSTVRDGAPCTVTFLRRSLPSRQTAECNLGSLEKERLGSGTSILIMELLRLAKNVEAQ